MHGDMKSSQPGIAHLVQAIFLLNKPFIESPSAKITLQRADKATDEKKSRRVFENRDRHVKSREPLGRMASQLIQITRHKGDLSSRMKGDESASDVEIELNRRWFFSCPGAMKGLSGVSGVGKDLTSVQLLWIKCRQCLECQSVVRRKMKWNRFEHSLSFCFLHSLHYPPQLASSYNWFRFARKTFFVSFNLACQRNEVEGFFDEQGWDNGLMYWQF